MDEKAARMTKHMKQAAVNMREAMMRNIYQMPEAIANMSVREFMELFPNADMSLFELKERPSKGTVRKPRPAAMQQPEEEVQQTLSFDGENRRVRLENTKGETLSILIPLGVTSNRGIKYFTRTSNPTGCIFRFAESGRPKPIERRTKKIGKSRSGRVEV